MGRRKIEMKMVRDSNSRQVTFSKRRTGLFKKANELATLCGAEVGIVVFSPGGKPFSFGQPNVESIADRFLNQEPKSTRTASISSSKKKKNDNNNNKVAAAAAMEKLNKQLNNHVKHLHEEKKRGDAIEKEITEQKGLYFGSKNGKSIDELNKTELARLKKELEELKERVKERVVEMEASSTLLMLSNAVEPPSTSKANSETRVAKYV